MMFVQYFGKTMILILTYLILGASISVLALYIHQIRAYLKLETKPECSNVQRMAKALVFTINLLALIGSIVAAVMTFPWAMEMKDAIGALVIAQPAFAIVFLGLSAYPILYIKKYVMESNS